MRIAIIQFPGSNCERETMLAVKRANMEPVEFLWNEEIKKLDQCAGFVIVGGFSYEDRSRAGIIAALDPLMGVLKEQSKQGKPILGICNGAQILVESGLVPGIENHKVGVALTENKRIQQGKVLGTGYYNAWVHIRLANEYQRNAFTRCLTEKDVLRVPVAHAEGRFVMNSGLLLEVQSQGLNVFQYCDAQGNIIPEFPINPNGSIDNIAALSNKAGNVLAIMPHPERTTVGDKIFQSMHDYIAEGYVEKVQPLYYYPRSEEPKPYKTVNGVRECIVESIITDNAALTVESTLNQLGIPVTIRRFAHWEIAAPKDTQEKILKSGVLYNDRKESLVTLPSLPETKWLLVRAKEDVLGQEKQQMLQDHFALNAIGHIRHGILWQISVKEKKIDDLINQVIKTHILFNPYAYDCYRYAT